VSSNLEHLTDNSKSERNFQRLWNYIKSATQREAIHLVGGTGEPAFQNSWVHFDSGTGTPGGGTQRDVGFYRHAGRVHLQGVTKTGASGTTAFTLPAGYRPITARLMMVAASGGTAWIAINSDGTVVPTNTLGSGVATYCFLDGVSFRYGS
jgi:hypothetical protein